MFDAVIQTPIGNLGIIVSDTALLGIEFLSDDVDLIPPKASMSKKVVSQLKSYFKDPKFHFDLPIELNGRPFQKAVWCALKKIPVGKTKTYSELSDELDSGPRAVGNACRHNPIPVVIPCHRIVAKNGLGGFAGDTTGRKMEIKRWLLGHEMFGLDNFSCP